MHYALTTTTAPTSEPVSLADAKLHCRVDGTDEDTIIESLIVAARVHVEQITGRALVTQTLKMTMDAFPDEIRLPRAPAVSATIAYIDAAGVTQTLSPSLYIVDAESQPARIVPAYGQSWPATQDRIGAVTVSFVAGKASTAVDKPITQAMLLMVGHWFNNRETVLIGSISKELEFTVEALLAPYRLYL